MPYIYQADIYCDSCGRDIANEIFKTTSKKNKQRFQDEYKYDSDEFPKYTPNDEEADCPQHCGCGDFCLEAEVLPSGRRIGALLSTSLTDDGARYVKEKVAEGGEVANFWKNAFYWVEFD